MGLWYNPLSPHLLLLITRPSLNTFQLVVWTHMNRRRLYLVWSKQTQITLRVTKFRQHIRSLSLFNFLRANFKIWTIPLSFRPDLCDGIAVWEMYTPLLRKCIVFCPWNYFPGISHSPGKSVGLTFQPHVFLWDSNFTFQLLTLFEVICLNYRWCFLKEGLGKVWAILHKA